MSASLTSLQSSYSSCTLDRIRSPIYLDHIELKSAFRYEGDYSRELLPGFLSQYFNLPIIKYGTHSGSIGGDYHASSCGRRILNAFHGRDTERPRRRGNLVSTHNSLTETERQKHSVVAGESPHWIWSVTMFAGALAQARERVFTDVIKKISHQGNKKPLPLFGELFFPITCPQIEFYREYPVPANEAELFAALEKAISSCFGDVYDSEKREKYSRRWLIKAFNGARGKAVWIKCYRKGGYFRLEVQIRNPELSEVVGEDLSPLIADLISIGNFASRILDQIDAKLDYQFSSIDVGKLEQLLHALFPRAFDSKKFSIFIKCIAETASYTPSDHAKKDRISREHHLKTMVDRGILECHKLSRFMGEKLKLRPVKKYFYVLSPHWRQVARSILNNTKTSEKGSAKSLIHLPLSEV